MSLRADDHFQRVAVPVVYVAAMFMAIMDTTIINVALPTIGRDLHAGPGQVSLVSTAYLVSLTVFIPTSGWLGDRIGGRRALLWAVGLFTVASALCGLATSLPELIAFRVLQGTCGAVMTPVGLAMLFRVYPPAERVRMAGILALFTALAPALGPVIGGLFTTDLSWRWVFFINMPVGAAAFAFGALTLAGHHQPYPGRLDLPGLLLSGLGLGAAVYGVSEGPEQGWGSPAVLVLLISGAACLAAMVVVEWRTRHPLVDLRLFGNRLFGAATSTYGLLSVAYLGTLYLVAQFFQNALGLSALQSGLAVFPSALGVMAGGQLATRRLYPVIGPRRVMIGGLLVATAATACLALAGPGTSLWLIRLTMLILGLGVSNVFIPAQAVSMATITHEQTGRAASLFNAAKQLGSAVGVALLTTVVALASPGHSAGHAIVSLPAFHDGFLAAAALTLSCVPLALRVSDADAAHTMVRRPHHGPPPPRPRRRSGRSRPHRTGPFQGPPGLRPPVDVPSG